MASRKTPLRESAPTVPGRSARSDTRSKVARRRAVVGAVIVLLVAGGGVFLLTSGSDGGIIGIGKSEAPPQPVTFTVKKASFEATVAGTDKAKQHTAAEATAKHVTPVLETLFFTGYSDPGTWGDVGAIEGLFTEDARGQLEEDAGVLTLGADAGDTYERIEPGKSTVTVRALTDGNGKATRAYARATFEATAFLDDGTSSEITVTGSYFLVPTGDGWQIEAYRAGRVEKPIATPSGTASPSGGAS